LGVQDRVRQFPPVPRHQVIGLARTADVGIITTLGVCLNNVLSLPNKLFEYGFAGLPIVASDLPQIRDWVCRYKLGCVVDPTDAKAIAEAIEAILTRRAPLASEAE